MLICVKDGGQRVTVLILILESNTGIRGLMEMLKLVRKEVVVVGIRDVLYTHFELS